MAFAGIFALLGSSSAGTGDLPNPFYVPALAGTGEPIFLIGLIAGMLRSAGLPGAAVSSR